MFFVNVLIPFLNPYKLDPFLTNVKYTQLFNSLEPMIVAFEISQLLLSLDILKIVLPFISAIRKG